MASDIVETYRALSVAFETLNVRWYVFGAQAAIFHGVARATADIDVTVDLGTRSTTQLASGLIAAGFELRIADEAFVEKTRVLPVVYVVMRVPVDVVIAGPGLEELFFERLVEREVGGVRVPIASAEDVIVMKVLAGRAKDLDDVTSILTAKRNLDLEQVRETLSLLEKALDQSDLLPLFETLRKGR